MGGVYPHSGLLASFNFSCARFLIVSPEECEDAARTAVENMPPEVSLVFSGNHVGDNIWTGSCLTSRQGRRSEETLYILLTAVWERTVPAGELMRTLYPHIIGAMLTIRSLLGLSKDLLTMFNNPRKVEKCHM